MAKNIIAQVAGGSKQVLDDVDTVGELRSKLSLGTGYTAAVNGDSQSDDYNLDDGDFVTFAKATKGGC